MCISAMVPSFSCQGQDGAFDLFLHFNYFRLQSGTDIYCSGSYCVRFIRLGSYMSSSRCLFSSKCIRQESQTERFPWMFRLYTYLYKFFLSELVKYTVRRISIFTTTICFLMYFKLKIKYKSKMSKDHCFIMNVENE